MSGFLKKLLGSGEKPAPVVPRSPRVRIPLVDHSIFVAASGKAYSLRNLSETGLALLAPGEVFPLESAGEIRVGGLIVPVKLRVVRQNGDEVGIAFGEGGAEVRALLRRLFVDEVHALGMSEVDSARQKAAEIGRPRWFYAPDNYELYFVEHEGKVLLFEMEWNGHLLAWAGGQLRYGEVDRDARAEVAHARSSLVKWQSEVASEPRLKGLRILENIPGLEVSARAQMQLLLRG